MNMQVSNSRKLLVKLVGTMNGISWEDGPGLSKSLQASFRPLITSAVKVNLPTVINKEAIDLLEIDSKPLPFAGNHSVSAAEPSEKHADGGLDGG